MDFEVGNGSVATLSEQDDGWPARGEAMTGAQVGLSGESRDDSECAGPALGDRAGVGVVGLGRWLADNRALMDRGEAGWLDRLGEFDRNQLWALDGSLSCCSWLMWATGMARSTAFERLRVARELFRDSSGAHEPRSTPKCDEPSSTFERSDQGVRTVHGRSRCPSRPPRGPAWRGAVKLRSTSPFVGHARKHARP